MIFILIIIISTGDYNRDEVKRCFENAVPGILIICFTCVFNLVRIFDLDCARELI